ncbi:hypothetical protein [Streptomyces nojiriensis]|uniref:hypothetical protein n=1 Tax=Streptomyces nojiriensis TaxID=66374 RepID=UPI00367C2C8A
MRRRIAEHPDPAIHDAYADFVRTMVERGVPMSVEDLVEAYDRVPTELAAASDPRVRAMVAATWRDRPITVQLALTDPDPGVRAAATRSEHPGVPDGHYERCLADPAVQANIARRLALTSDQFARLLATGGEAVLHAVAGNPHLTADMVTYLQGGQQGSAGSRVAAAGL